MKELMGEEGLEENALKYAVYKIALEWKLIILNDRLMNSDINPSAKPGIMNEWRSSKQATSGPYWVFY